MDKTQRTSLENLSLDKNVEDIIYNSQYGQKRVIVWISLVNLSMDKNVEDILDILSKSQYGQIGRGYPQ